MSEPCKTAYQTLLARHDAALQSPEALQIDAGFDGLVSGMLNDPTYFPDAASDMREDMALQDAHILSSASLKAHVDAYTNQAETDYLACLAAAQTDSK